MLGVDEPNNDLTAKIRDESFKVREAAALCEVVPVRVQHKMCQRFLAACTCLLCFLMTVALAFVGFYSQMQRELHEKETVRQMVPVLPAEDYTELGCFPFQNGDGTGGGLLDMTCMTTTEGQPCRSGLPFYNLKFAGSPKYPINPRLCATFCQHRGFDISGVVQTYECRCGATEQNTRIWMQTGDSDGGVASSKKKGLVWPGSQKVVAKTDASCAMLVMQYQGQVPFVSDEVDESAVDDLYIASIVTGRHVTGEEKQKVLSVAPVAPLPKNSTVEQKWDAREFIKSRDFLGLNQESPICYQRPTSCAAGWLYPIHGTLKATGIPYYFDPLTIGDNTEGLLLKAQFRAAVDHYHASTCVRFQEVGSQSDVYCKVKILQFNNLVCSSDVGGYSRCLMGQEPFINIGCNPITIGTMVHEIGHQIGMSHEQSRPDVDQYLTYLRPETKEIIETSYTAAPYDYESVMHYPGQGNFVTKGNAYDSVIGQEHGLSSGDVSQVRDMYGCDVADQNSLCADTFVPLQGGGRGDCNSIGTAECTGELWKLYTYYCPRKCGRCLDRDTTSLSANIDGCRDASVVCNKYAEYCPGRSLVGSEEWMAEFCRETCNTARYCTGVGRGAGTTAALPCVDAGETGILDASTGQAMGCEALEGRCSEIVGSILIRTVCPVTCKQCGTARPTDERVLSFNFKIGAENGYDVADAGERGLLEQAMARRFDDDLSIPTGSDLATHVSILAPSGCGTTNRGRGFGCLRGEARVKVPCGCQYTEENGDTCGNDCASTEQRLAGYTDAKILDMFTRYGLSGINEADDTGVEQNPINRFMEVFKQSNASVLIVAVGVAIMSCICCCLLCCIYRLCAAQYFDGGWDDEEEEGEYEYYDKD